MGNQLKVGDFIRYTNIPSVVFQVKESNLANVKFWERKTPHELWSPLVNEWVWHKLLGNLCQYKGPIEDSDLFSFYVPNFNHPQYSVTCASTLECEPYLGTLPTYIN